MNRFDDYDLHRKRYVRLKKRRLLPGSDYEFCGLCGRSGLLEFHHYARAKHDNRALPLCRDCHDVFRDREAFEHPPLYDDLGDHRERQRRQLMAFTDILEFIASELRIIVGSSTFELGTRIVRDGDQDT